MIHSGPTTAIRDQPLISNGWAVVCGAALVFSCALPVPSADGRIAHLPSICLFHNLTGLPCPGCGLTRSFVCLAHGHIGESFRYHALGPILFIFMLATVAYAVFERLRPDLRIRPSAAFRRLAPLVAAAVFLIVWIGRLAGFDPLPG